MKHLLIFSVIFLMSFSSVKSQEDISKSPVKWYTIQQVDSLNKIQARPLFIDVYTEWCGWCKKMMKETFSNPSLANYINNNFYAVRFDAESIDTVSYKGKFYTNPGIGSKPKHDFAKLILKGRFSFPTIVYIDRKGNVNAVPGFMDAKQIEPILVYFGEEVNFNVNYPDFENYYFQTFPKAFEKQLSELKTSSKIDTLGKVKWLNPQQAYELSLKNGKPLYFHFYTDWSQSCKVAGTVYKNSVIADILNNEYNPVNFNAASQDTFNFFGKEFKSNGVNNPHSLTYALLKASFKFPADIFITPQGNIINEIHGLMMPSQIERILKYLNDDKYKTIKFKDFMKTFKTQIK